MAELLLELLSEEIPARMQARAASDLARLTEDALKEAGLAPGAVRSFATPRRLVLVADDVPVKQADVKAEQRGPRVDAPEQAINGFLKANGLTSTDQCEQRETKKGTFWFVVIDRAGEDAVGVLPDILSGAITKLSWAKSMRWGTGGGRWVRPLQQCLCVFGGAPLALVTVNGITAGNATRGHRFMASAPIENVKNFDDYATRLRDAYVIIDPAERRRIIADGAAALAKGEGISLVDDPALLDEVTGLVEWPVPLIGGIDDGFMDLPAEVLTTAMRTHQKYFALENADGSLANRFILVANIDAPDGGKQIIAGNERVLRARLSDARFFWDQDRKLALSDRVDDLDKIVFHAKLGSLGDKVTRLQSLAVSLAAYIPGCDRDQVRSAATLAKADLSTGMVGEFPGLQGIMGSYYARHDGEQSDVADAIEAHYHPQGPSDACPDAPVGIALALADRIDTLFWFFAIEETPTGSKDPFALRRAAQGVIRLVLENGLRLRLGDAFAAADKSSPMDAPDGTGGALLEFIADRLKVHLRDEGVRHDLISAVFAPGPEGKAEDDLVRLLARVRALEVFLGTEDGKNLLAASKRAGNIVAIEEKKDGAAQTGPVDSALLVEDDEKALFAALEDVQARIQPLIKAEQFDAAMGAFATLRAPVDAFFDNVTVNADTAELRCNRLRLLSQIRVTMGAVADFTRVEG